MELYSPLLNGMHLDRTYRKASKYSFDIKILSSNRFIIPEYKIELLNKSKKVLNSVEYINPIIKLNNIKENNISIKKEKNKEITKSKNKIKKTKSKKTVRTLWVRRKKKN